MCISRFVYPFLSFLPSQNPSLSSKLKTQGTDFMTLSSGPQLQLVSHSRRSLEYLLCTGHRARPMGPRVSSHVSLSWFFQAQLPGTLLRNDSVSAPTARAPDAQCCLGVSFAGSRGPGSHLISVSPGPSTI